MLRNHYVRINPHQPKYTHHVIVAHAAIFGWRDFSLALLANELTGWRDFSLALLANELTGWRDFSLGHYNLAKAYLIATQPLRKDKSSPTI